MGLFMGFDGFSMDLPAGQRLRGYRKSPLRMRNLTINGPCSIALKSPETISLKRKRLKMAETPSVNRLSKISFELHGELLSTA